MTVSDEMIERAAKALCRLAYPSRTLDEHLAPNVELWTRLMPEARAALTAALEAGAVVPVAWIVERPNDPTFPRLFKTEAEARSLVKYVNVNPAATMRALAYAASASSEAGAWQPIETAPDRTNVLALEDFHRENDDGRKYPKDYQVVKKINGEWNSYGITLVSFEPTHWQPLPAPPVTRHERGDTTSAPSNDGRAQ